MDSKIMQCSIVNVNDQSAPPKNFTFDGAYGPESTTENIYNEIAYPLVEVGKKLCTVVYIQVTRKIIAFFSCSNLPSH